MKLSRRTLNFMLKNNYKAIDSLVRGLLLKAYGFSDEVVAAAYLLDLVRDGKLLIDDVSRLFGGKTASLIITALPYSSSDNLSSYENDRQFIKTIKNLPLNNAALICADVITSLEKVDLQFIKANKKDFDSLKIDAMQAKAHYLLIYDTFSDIYDLGLLKRLKGLIDTIFDAESLTPDTFLEIESLENVDAADELNSLKNIINSSKPYIIELCATGNLSYKSLYGRLLSFFNDDSFKVKVKDEMDSKGRFEEEIISDKTGISSLEKNVILLSSLKEGLLKSIIGDKDVLIVDEDLYDILLYLDIMVKSGKISLEDIRRYFNYYRFDLKYLFNYTCFHYNALSSLSDDMFFDHDDLESIRHLVEGLSNEANLNEGETTIVVAGTLLPIMQDSKIFELKKIIHKDE